VDGKLKTWLTAIALFFDQKKKKKKVCDLLQVTKETMSEKYLRLPVHVGQSKTGTFGYLKDLEKNTRLE
jgi:hypothetical protein